MATLTKQALKDALMKLLEQRPLDRITVQEVTEAAGVSRKTFYYHFRDIFDLVEWTLLDEIQRFDRLRNETENWTQDLVVAFQYATEHRRMISNLVQTAELGELERIVRRIISPRVERIFDQAAAGQPVYPEDRQFIVDIFSFGITGMFLSWIRDGMKGDSVFLREKISYFFQDSMALMARRCIQDRIGETTDRT